MLRRVSSAALAPSIESARSDLHRDEESFGPILTEIARMLYPPPKTAAQIAAAIGCTERNAEACLSGRQKWSGDAVAHFVAEICRRHAMRNIKINPKRD